MRMVKKNQKRLMVMSVVLFMICAMALGYAALSSSLKISGTGTISANWDILFTNIEEGSKKGATSNESVITDKLTATFDVDLNAPGDYIEYHVTIKNNGNIDAVIENIIGIADINRQPPTDIKFSIEGIRTGDDLLAGEEKTFVVRSEFNQLATNLPTINKSLDLKINVKQKDSSGSTITALKNCFVTNKAGDAITGYLCGKGNPNGYSEILDVTIPERIDGVTITKIDSNAFFNMQLIAVHLPDSLLQIEQYAFRRNQLTEITLPPSLKFLGYAAFQSNHLTEITIPDQVEEIEAGVFESNQLTKAILPSSLKTIPPYLFSGNRLETVMIPEGVTTIGSGAFMGNQLTQLKLPDGLTKIGNVAFSSNLLTTITFPNTVVSLGDSAFYHNQLISLVIPAGVQELGKHVFSTNLLTSVIFQGPVPTKLGVDIFGANPILSGTSPTIQVPAGTLATYKTVTSTENNQTIEAPMIWFGIGSHSLNCFYE